MSETVSIAPIPENVDEEAQCIARREGVLQPKRNALDAARENGATLEQIDALADDLRGWAVMYGI